MAVYKQKTICFLDKDKDVYAHLMQQDNASRYIAKLIRRDMETPNLEALISQIVDKKLESKRSNISSSMLKGFD